MKFLLNGLTFSLLLVYSSLNAQFSVTIQLDQPIHCYGGSDAVLSAVVNPAGSTYSFSWSNGATSSSVSDLPAGAYSVTVQNAAGGIAIATTIVSEPEALTLTPVTQLPVLADPTASVEVETSGGVTPYAFQWENEQQQPVSNEEDLHNATAGTYTLSATDANGCTAVLSPVELLQTTATKDLTQEAPDIFPNPATTTLSVTPPPGKNPQLMVFNAAGALFYSEYLKGNTVLDLQNWPSGLYILYFPELNERRQVLVAH